MSLNIEIKAYYPNINQGRDIAISIGAKYLGCEHQIDTYFKTANGRLKLREIYPAGTAILVPYIREDRADAKTSNYTLIEIKDIVAVKNLFSKVMGVDVIVEKDRHIYLLDNVRIHLDEVKGLGSFFELEAVCSASTVIDEEHLKVKELLQTFKVEDKNLIEGSYREMKLNKKINSNTIDVTVNLF